MAWKTALAVFTIALTTKYLAKLYINTPSIPKVTCIGRGGADGQLCVKWAISNFNLRTVSQEALSAAYAECHVNCPSLEHQKCWPIDVTDTAMNYTCVDEDWFPEGIPVAEYEALRLQTREGRADNHGLV